MERPLRLNFQATYERVARLEEEKGFQALAQSKKKGTVGAKEQAEGRTVQERVRALVRGLAGAVSKDRAEFERALDGAAVKTGLKLPAPVRKAILAALAERDETAAVCRDDDGDPEPDPDLRDTESVPLPAGDDPADAEGAGQRPRLLRSRGETPRRGRLDRRGEARSQGRASA